MEEPTKLELELLKAQPRRGVWYVGTSSGSVCSHIHIDSPRLSDSDEDIKAYGGYMLFESCRSKEIARLIYYVPEMESILHSLVRSPNMEAIQFLKQEAYKILMKLQLERE